MSESNVELGMLYNINHKEKYKILAILIVINTLVFLVLFICYFIKIYFIILLFI